MQNTTNIQKKKKPDNKKHDKKQRQNSEKILKTISKKKTKTINLQTIKFQQKNRK